MDVSHSRRVNPIQRKYIPKLAAASETAETLLESLQKGKKEGGGGSDQFFQTSAVNFLAACIYFFVNHEQWHTRKHYPYIGYGHRIQPGENLAYPITERQADSLLRSDLRKNCALFRKDGADSLLLGCVSNNCGCASLLGNSNKLQSTVFTKLDAGNRNILYDLLDFCHYKGKRHPYILRRRWMEYLLLFEY